MGSNVVLKWTTTAESNNAGFEVQRLINGEYKKVGFVDSKDDGTGALRLQYQYSEQEQCSCSKLVPAGADK